MITASPGHYGKGTGAHGLIDEGAENIRVTKQVVQNLRAAGIQTNYIEDNINKSQSKNINWLITQHNKTSRSIDTSIHFNASSGTTDKGIGVEVLVYDEKHIPSATIIVDGIAAASGLKNRGVKIRKDVGLIKNTNKPCYLIEVCFVNSKEDVALYQKHFNAICNSIAQSLARIVGKPITIEQKPIIRELHINSQALNDVTNAILSSKAQRQIIVDYAIANGAHASWREKLDKRIITDDEILALAAKMIVDSNK